MCCRGAASAGITGPTSGGGGAAASPDGADGAGQRLPADEPEGGAAESDTAVRQLSSAGQYHHTVRNTYMHTCPYMFHTLLM